MKALITGVAGFSGAHMARHLVLAGEAVAGLDRPGVSVRRLRELGLELEPEAVDLADSVAVDRVVAQAAPAVVYHLAGLSGTEGLEDMLTANVVCTSHLLAACSALDVPPRVLLVSSAGVYGHVPAEEQPIHEDRPLRPRGPYALSKAAMELLAWDYVDRSGLPVLVARTFNLLGPDAPAERLVGTVQRQLAEITAGTRPPVLELGDLSARRDYIWVDEAAMAYQAIAEKGVPGEAYNVCSGVARTARDIVEELIALSGLSDVTIALDASRVRTGEVDVSVGDPAKLRALA